MLVQETVDARVRRRVLRRLKQLDWRKNQLAAAMGHSTAWVTNFLNGKSQVPLLTAARVAKAIGVSLAALVRETEDESTVAETDQEQELLATWRRLAPAKQRDLLYVVGHLHRARAPKTKRRSGAAGPADESSPARRVRAG